MHIIKYGLGHFVCTVNLFFRTVPMRLLKYKTIKPQFGFDFVSLQILSEKISHYLSKKPFGLYKITGHNRSAKDYIMKSISLSFGELSMEAQL